MNRDQVIENAIQHLKAERDRLNAAISALEGSGARGSRGAAAKKVGPGRPRGKRRISAAGLARIRAAQKARWAKHRKENKG